MTRNEAIMKAWYKIKEYVEENYNGTFEKGIEFEWKHEVFGWTKFGVTNNGVAYIVHGSHGTSSLNEYYYCPFKKAGYEHARICRTEEVVNDWIIIKEQLKKLADKENRLYDFTV